MPNSHIALNKAQALCAEEKIHIPGAIQPHGVLIAIREPSLTIVQASQSASTIFGITAQELIEQPIARLIGSEQQAQLKRYLSNNATIANPQSFYIDCNTKKKKFEAIIHRSDELVVIEFEETSNVDTEQSLHFYRTSTQAVAQLISCSNEQELLELAASSVRALTGYDRVMVYLFDSEWNGTVVAECKVPEAKSYLSLKFPASDIPSQARELYKRLRLRLLVNVEASPSALYPPVNPLTQNSLDLSDSILRSMSPVHLEYLRNMKVTASMSISLISNGELRGLIACHHTRAKWVSYAVRQACDFISRVLSQQLEIFEERQTFRKTAELKDARQDLLLHLSGEEDLASAIAGSGKLLQVAGAEGAAVWWDDCCFLVGRTPQQRQVQDLVKELSKTNLVAFSTDSSSKHFPAAKSIKQSASGLLAIRAATGSSNWLLWFRPEQPQEVNWAGKREKLENGMSLHPRRSFDIWKEQVLGKALPWSNCEVQSVVELRTDILDLGLTVLNKKRARDLERQVEELNSLSQPLQIANLAAQQVSPQKSVSLVPSELEDLEKLSQRNCDSDDFDFRVLKSDHELSVAQSEFAEANRKYNASSSSLAPNVLWLESQFQESDAKFAELRNEFGSSKIEIEAILRERACFESALNDLRNPISRAIQMLQYIAIGQVAQDKQVEILNQIIDANREMLLGTEQIAKVAFELSQRTSQTSLRIAKIQQFKAELKAISRQREDFVAALAHDLQNPLIGSSQILEMFAAGLFSKRQNDHKVLNLVIESNRTILRMIRNILDIYRQETGSLVPLIESADLSELLAKCLNELSFNIKEKKLKLILDTSGARQLILTDVILLRRVLSNLLDNGIKFSPQGGELIVSAQSHEKQWRISVTDSGPGMSALQLEEIFQRLRPAKPGRCKGIATGLGLLSSKMIMDVLGGKVECMSNAQGGTTFFVIGQVKVPGDH